MCLLFIQTIVITASLLLPPLLGNWLAGNDPVNHLVFPPLTPPAPYAPFSWGVWLAMTGFVLIVLTSFIMIILRERASEPSKHKQSPFPIWGYTGLILVIVFWMLAWNRFTWFESFQVYTFTPIWLGYILTINAITARRTGHCLLTHQPLFIVGLFIFSAIFWWYYEYLNGFIHNWYYVNIDSLTTTEYVIHSSIAYATVLPAVISTIELLNSFPYLSQPLTGKRKLKPPFSITLPSFCLLGGIITLTLAACWPEQLFPLVWIAPLFIVAGGRTMLGEKTLFSYVAAGDWRPVVLPAIAALVCGFFWELWNSQSYAHWEYNISYVDTFHLFEMPAIGYAGYLPFGLVCLAIAELIPGINQIFIQNKINLSGSL